MGFLSSIDFSLLLWLSAPVLLVYTFYGTIYRLYLSPIAHIPGPKLAALTLWYEFYYDVIKKGRYTWKIKELHDVYGPVVRISPSEVHICDSEFYHEFYTSDAVRKADRWPWGCDAFAAPSSLVGTIDYGTHTMRRGAISNFFSRGAVAKLEPLVLGYVNKMVSQLKSHKGSNQPVLLDDVFGSMTADIITDYCFDIPVNHLDDPTFKSSFRVVMGAVLGISHFSKNFRIIQKLIQVHLMPSWLIALWDVGLGEYIQLRWDIETKIEQLRERGPDEKSKGRTTIFHSAMFESNLPPHEIAKTRLSEESIVIVAGGTMTVAHPLWNITWHLLDKPEIRAKLKEELTRHAEKNPDPTWQELEKLPYLSSVIKEGLRNAPTFTGRSQRILGSDLKYHDTVIPKGTAVGMSVMWVAQDPKVFVDPEVFSPERWIGPDKQRLEHYSVPFARGNRNCIGQNLALCEMYLTVAALFGPNGVDMEIFETKLSDIKVQHDFFAGYPKLDSKGCRVLVN